MACRKSVEGNENIVVDATFANQSERVEFVKNLKNYGNTEIVGMFFDVPYEIALERNSKRERVVPPSVIEKMHSSLKENPRV